MLEFGQENSLDSQKTISRYFPETSVRESKKGSILS